MSDKLPGSDQSLGKCVRSARRILKVSLEELANSLYVSKEFLDQIESGDRSLSLGLLQRIADCLDLTPRQLLIGNFVPYFAREENMKKHTWAN